MSHVSYPTTMPLDCARRVISIVREARVQDNKIEFAHCLWNIQGYLQGRFIGVIDVTAGVLSAPTNIGEVNDCCTELQEVLEAYTAVDIKFSSTPDDPEGKSAMTIIQIISMVLSTLKLLGVFTKGNAVTSFTPEDVTRKNPENSTQPFKAPGAEKLLKSNPSKTKSSKSNSPKSKK